MVNRPGTPGNSWQLPHQDAESYLLGCVEKTLQIEEREESLSRNSIDDQEAELDFDVIDAVEDDSIFAKDFFWAYDKQHAGLDAYAGTDGILPSLSFWGSEELQVHDLATQAIDSINQRNTADFIQCIDELADLRHAFQVVDVLANGTVENWVHVLDVPGDSQKRARKSRTEIKACIAARNLCVELCRQVADNPAALNFINWLQLEEVVATALEGLGFLVELTPSSGDGGRDVVAHCILKGEWATYYVEIKHWRSGKQVGEKAVSRFVEVTVRDSVQGGLFLSTSGFGDSVYSHLADFTESRVKIGSQEKVVFLCQQFVRSQMGLWHPHEAAPRLLMC